MFFTDTSVITDKTDAEYFNWCEQNHAIAEYAVWLMLTELGLVASLQHYTFSINHSVAAQFNIPSTWMLRAQMPFGTKK